MKGNNKIPSIVAIIPAYNEEKTIKGVIFEIRELNLPNMRILVMDDGSTDQTSYYAILAGATSIRHEINLGIGATLKTGYEAALLGHPDIVIQLDADGQHNPSEIPKLIQPILDGHADVVIGSRFLGSIEDLPYIRSLGIRFFTWITRKIISKPITDVTSGYRAYEANILKELLDFKGDNHWAVELTIKIAKKNLRIIEVPVTMKKRKEGTSQFNRVSTLLLYPFRVLWRVIMTHLNQ